GGDVGYHDAQQIVDLPAHPIELDDLRNAGDALAEALRPIGVVLVGADGDEHVDADIHPVRIEQGDAPRDDSGGLELLDAPPAGRGGEAGAPGDLLDGQRAILLQASEDSTVDIVHANEFHISTNSRNYILESAGLATQFAIRFSSSHAILSAAVHRGGDTRAEPIDEPHLPYRASGFGRRNLFGAFARRERLRDRDGRRRPRLPRPRPPAVSLRDDRLADDRRSARAHDHEPPPHRPRGLRRPTVARTPPSRIVSTPLDPSSPVRRCGMTRRNPLRRRSILRGALATIAMAGAPLLVSPASATQAEPVMVGVSGPVTGN